MSVRILLFLLIALLIIQGVSVGADYGVVTTEQLKALLEAKRDSILIDARTPEEYEQAHIPGAVNIHEKNLDCGLLQLPSDRKAPLVIYCNGIKCGKSAKMAQRIEAAGYENISIYREGIPVWEERNLPLKTGPEYGKKIAATIIKPEDLKKIVDTKDPAYVIVDVREQNEYAEGHIPGALNIPAERFAVQSEVLPKDKNIVVYCNSGSRSYLAYRKLIQLAYPNRYQAILADWKDAGLPLQQGLR